MNVRVSRRACNRPIAAGKRLRAALQSAQSRSAQGVSSRLIATQAQSAIALGPRLFGPPKLTERQAVIEQGLL